MLRGLQRNVFPFEGNLHDASRTCSLAHQLLAAIKMIQLDLSLFEDPMLTAQTERSYITLMAGVTEDQSLLQSVALCVARCAPISPKEQDGCKLGPKNGVSKNNPHKGKVFYKARPNPRPQPTTKDGCLPDLNDDVADIPLSIPSMLPKLVRRALRNYPQISQTTL